MKARHAITLSLLFISAIAEAQVGLESGESSAFSLSPIFNVLLGIAFFVFVAYTILNGQRKAFKKEERHIQHMERVEALLERIASALEQK